MQIHFKRLSSAIDDLPLEQDFELSQQSELQLSEPSGPPQQFGNQILGQEPGEQHSESSQVDFQPITPDTSTQTASKKKRKGTWYCSWKIIGMKPWNVNNVHGWRDGFVIYANLSLCKLPECGYYRSPTLMLFQNIETIFHWGTFWGPPSVKPVLT